MAKGDVNVKVQVIHGLPQKSTAQLTLSCHGHGIGQGQSKKHTYAELNRK